MTEQTWRGDWAAELPPHRTADDNRQRPLFFPLDASPMRVIGILRPPWK